ncbi:ABC transporter permease subunit [Amycolatopsis sp. NPDC047767]|uniref:ABC transporter permease n=1 Tax=Amycolatopsis sp. NPDC047767 TaxID=3156765 RepID=UPI0034518A76
MSLDVLPRRAGPRRGHRPALSTFVLGLSGLVLLAAAEEVVARSGLVSTQYLPPASVILTRLGELLTNAPFLADLGATAGSALLALVIAVPAGLVVGLVLGLVPAVHTATRIVVDLLRPVPAVAIVPLLVLVTGTGRASVVITIVSATVWPVLLNTIHGVRDVDGVALQTARLYGARLPRRLAEIVLPSAAPVIAAGVRVSIGLALVIAVAAELLIGTDSGVGAYLLAATQGGSHTDYAFAAVCAAGLLGLVVNGAARALERRFLPWSEGEPR